jgi:hypothetical protein
MKLMLPLVSLELKEFSISECSMHLTEAQNILTKLYKDKSGMFYLVLFFSLAKIEKKAKNRQKHNLHTITSRYDITSDKKFRLVSSLYVSYMYRYITFQWDCMGYSIKKSDKMLK